MTERRNLRDVARQFVISGARRSGAGSLASWAVASLPRKAVSDSAAPVVVRPMSGPQRVALVAHYDVRPLVAASFVRLCCGLSEAGLRVVVVSTADVMAASLADRLEPVVDTVIVRDNIGFDFMSWQRGLEQLHRQGVTPHQLILTNGSMYGPLWGLADLIDQQADQPVWGMTESLDFRRHIQSWWLGFSGKAANSRQFADYFSQIRPATNKWGTILAHELRWAQDLTPPGLQPGVVASVTDHGCRRNPLFFAWRKLVEQCEVPFVKRSLFTHNYDQIDTTGWSEFLQNVAPGFDTSLVQRDIDVAAMEGL